MLCETDCLSFSTAIDEEHMLIVPKKTFDQNESSIKSKNTFLAENLMNNFSINYDLDVKKTKKEKKGCCSCFSNCFKKK
jgi:hypothetical protein